MEKEKIDLEKDKIPHSNKVSSSKKPSSGIVRRESNKSVRLEKKDDGKISSNSGTLSQVEHSGNSTDTR